ncbi:transposase [Ectopseudomonas toyotomiensis]|uniref:Putative transposase n=1 Tax=Ectopseudomonas toyotomiensis TaxID=554344 RepID=A0A1I5Z722_9GAMM|nr:DNA-binding protein [Pseudomonas toyotomiensis]PIA66337.1 transposase [Pseudomonas toyotomiensis]SFQ52145.1 putative transposase [Pseudomonas toyotomiensis]
MRKWFTAQELAGLPGMPGTVQGVRLAAARESWEGQRRLGSKAIEYSFAVLPAETQAALVARMVQAEQPAEAPKPTAPHTLTSPQRDGISTSRLSDDQRDVMSARVSIIREVERMSQMVSQQRAILALVGLARDGQLSPYLAERVERANDRKTPDRTLSERTIKRWLADFRKHGEIALAPIRRKPDMTLPVWAPVFLKHYQRPQKPSAEAAYAAFQAEYPGAPSIHAVRRMLAKMPPQAREQGRIGAREIKSLKAFHRRTADMLWPNDVWIADGHTFDAEVMNPLTGQIFRPEVTMVIDWGTRRIVGFSVNLAESTIATLDTLRDGVSRVGMYKVLYVDNGSGFDNAVVYEVNDRLGGTITHSLPYNSQGRGVIERPHKTILVRLSKTYDSYIGKDMDKEAATRVHRLSRQQLSMGLQPKQIPTFDTFFADLQNALDAYNHRPHRALPKIRDIETGKLRNQSPMESWKSALADGWEPLKAEAHVVEALVRPQVVRTTNRAEVRIFGGIYFLQALEGYHGQEVRVAYDFRDASRVWVHTLDGELIGEAVLGGNASPAMPQSLMDKATEKREKGQLARLVKKAKTVTGQDVELHVVPKAALSAELTEQQLEDAREYAALTLERQAPTFTVPDNDMTRYDLWQELEARRQRGEALCEAEANWHAIYPNNPGFKAIQRMYDHFAAAEATA